MADEEQIDEPAATVADAAPASPAAAVATPTPDAGPALSPKESRRLKRSTHRGESAEPRPVAERIAEREAARTAKAGARRRRRASARAERGEPAQGTPPAEHEPGARKVRQGIVISAKADKTITVKIEIVRRHRTYEKVIRKTGTLHAHDERNDAHEGDIVRIIEARPLSRTKRWRLVEVVERAR